MFNLNLMKKNKVVQFRNVSSISFVFLGLFSIAGCSSIDVSSELQLLEQSMIGIDASVTKLLKSKVAAELDLLPAEAAKNGEQWSLSEDCNAVGTTASFVSSPSNDEKIIANLSDCKIEKVVKASAIIKQSDAQVAKRKIAGLTEYISALTALASANSETEIIQGVVALSSSVGKLNAEVSSKSFSNFVRKLKKNEDKISSSVKFTIENLRAQRMRKVVIEMQEPFRQTVKDVKSFLYALEINIEFKEARADLKIAKDEAEDAGANNNIHDREIAFRNLQKKHKAFLRIGSQSIYIKLDYLEQSHSLLADRLSKNPSIEEILNFLESLKALTDTLEIT